MIIEIYTDGSSRLDTGESGCGWVIKIDGELASSGNINNKKKLTNNEEEYNGVICSLEDLENYRPAENEDVDEVNIHTDSLLVVNQVNGSFKTRKAHLRPLRDKVRELMAEATKTLKAPVTLTHVYRDSNKDADQLSRGWKEENV